MGLDQYAYKARRQNPNETISDDEYIEIVDGSHTVVTDGKWYGRKINLIQHYMEKTANIGNCECVYITEDMLDELENALAIIDKAAADDDTISSLIASHTAIPDEGITHIDGDKIFDFTFTDEEAAKFGEFMFDNAPDELMPDSGFLYGPSHMDAEYYLHQLTEVRGFINTVRRRFAAVEGVAIVALCGKKFRPQRRPDKYPVCPTCKEILDQLPPGDDGDD